MIKNLGGVFGRNPTFNNVEVEGDLTVDGNYVVAGDIAVTGNATITGTLGVTGQITGVSGVKLEDAALNTTVLSQDHTANKQLEISSYYSGTALQLPWVRNVGGSIISIGDLDNQTGQSGPIAVWDCENGIFSLTVNTAQISVSSSSMDFGTLNLDVATGNVSLGSGSFTSVDLTASSKLRGQTISIGNSLIIQGTGNITTTSITQTTLLSLSATTYSSVKYFIQARNTTTARFQITEIVTTRNATTTVVTATPIDTNTGGIVSAYAVDISGGNFRLLITPQATSPTVFKVLYTAIP